MRRDDMKALKEYVLGHAPDERTARLRRAFRQLERDFAALVDAIDATAASRPLERDELDRVTKAEEALLGGLAQLTATMHRAQTFTAQHRPQGSRAANTRYIEQLAKDHPGGDAKTLYGKADPRQLGGIAFATFRNKLSKARKHLA
jgi:hypothetical protein